MKTSPNDTVRAMYDDSAAKYAAMMDAEIDLPMYADVLGRLAERLAGVDGAIVDTSCGSGHMLARYHERYEPRRALVGVDLSPRMVDIANKLLGESAEVVAGDMRDLGMLASGSASAVLSFFAVHHLDAEANTRALTEWHRVLGPGGQLVIAAWEGSGPIDYGGAADVVALRYTQQELTEWTKATGFIIDRCVVKPVEEMEMDVVYLEATRG